MDEWAEFQDAPASAADEWAEFADAPSEGPAAPKSKAQPKRRRNIYGNVAGFMANVNRGLGIGDELAALAATGVNALTGNGPQGFSANMAAQRGLEDEYRADRPKAAALATGTGNALTMLAPAGPGAAAFANGSRGVNALRGATVAGLSGAAYSAADRGTVDERMGAAARAAYDPIALGLGAGAGAIARPMASKPKAKPGSAGVNETVDRLRIARDDAYRDVDASGFRFGADDLKGLADDIEAEVRKRGGPKAAKAFPDADAMIARLRALAETPDGVSLPQLDLLRRDIYDIMVGPEGKEAFLGKAMRQRIDKMTAEAQAPFIQEARAANTRYEKAGADADRVRSAELAAGRAHSGENFGNALRQKISPLIDPLHGAEITNLTPDEAAALERVVIGDKTQNAMRTWGNRLRNPMWTGAATTPAALMGFAGGGPVGGGVVAGGVAAGMQAAGQTLRRAAEARTMQNVRAVMDLIEQGGEVAAEVTRQLNNPQYSELRAQIANKLAGQSGVQSAGSRPAIEIDISRSTNPEHLAWRRANGLD